MALRRSRRVVGLAALLTASAAVVATCSLAAGGPAGAKRLPVVLTTPFVRVLATEDGHQLTVPLMISRAAVSTDGRRVGFGAAVCNDFVGACAPAETYMRDRRGDGWNAWPSMPDAGEGSSGWSNFGDMTPDGRKVVFDSDGTGLRYGPDTNHQRDVFMWSAFSASNSLVSVGVVQRQANGGSSGPAVSADGRYVAFASRASNLVRHDSNHHRDVFVRDLKLAVTRLVSVSTAGRQGNGYSGRPAISANGRYVAFASAASDLVAGDTNGCSDAFVRDLRTQVTTRVSVTDDERQMRRPTGAPFISGDGSVVGFTYDFSDRTSHVVRGFLRDRSAHTTEPVAVSENRRVHEGSDFGAIALSGNGRFVLFSTYAAMTADDTDPPTTDLNEDEVLDGDLDVFVRDLATGRVALVSVLPGSTQPVEASSADLSSDGRWALLRSSTRLRASDTNNLDELWLRDVSEVTGS